MDRHLCGCRRCTLYAKLEHRIADRQAVDELLADDWYKHAQWVKAMKAEQDARAQWLDHVLDHQQPDALPLAA